MEQDSGIEEVVGEGGRRISRRTLIKGSAVVGATVWAAPVVESFTSRAFAASATHYCCACANPLSGQTGTVANTSLKYGLKSDLFFVEKVQLASFFFSKKGKGVVMLGLVQQA
jgi:hypothetical protein